MKSRFKLYASSSCKPQNYWSFKNAFANFAIWLVSLCVQFDWSPNLLHFLRLRVTEIWLQRKRFRHLQINLAPLLFTCPIWGPLCPFFMANGAVSILFFPGNCCKDQSSFWKEFLKKIKKSSYSQLMIESFDICDRRPNLHQSICMAFQKLSART